LQLARAGEAGSVEIACRHGASDFEGLHGELLNLATRTR
jgi:hypothetical protein